VSGPRWGRVKELLHQAITLNPAASAKFLDEERGADTALRAALESLMSVGDELSAEFMQSPPPGN
jgi:hypothetical protein